MDLSIISVVKNDNGLFDLMIKSVYKFTDFIPQFVVSVNTESEYTNISNKYKESNFNFLLNCNKLSGSLQHGQSLNLAFSKVKTKYTAIIESDCVILNKDWYKTNKRIIASKKGENLYHVCFLLFETSILKGIDFRPGTGKDRVSKPYKPEEDVGHMIQKFIKKEEIDFLDFVDCKTERAQIFKNFQSDEFCKNDKVILAHFGRGSNLGGKKYIQKFGTQREQLNRWKKIVNELL